MRNTLLTYLTTSMIRFIHSFIHSLHSCIKRFCLAHQYLMQQPASLCYFVNVYCAKLQCSNTNNSPENPRSYAEKPQLLSAILKSSSVLQFFQNTNTHAPNNTSSGNNGFLLKSLGLKWRSTYQIWPRFPHILSAQKWISLLEKC